MRLLIRPPPVGSTTVIFFILALHVSSATQNYIECEKPYVCGNLTLGYPFSGVDRPVFCGHPSFNLSCEEDDSGSYSVIAMEGRLKFRVLEIDQSSYRMQIARVDLWENPCSYAGYGNTTLDYRFFDFYQHVNQNLTMFYDCGHFAELVPFTFNCSINGEGNSHNYYLSNLLFDDYLPGYQGAYWFYSCYNHSVTVPILSVNMDKLMSNGSLSLQEALNGGFDVNYNTTGEICRKCESTNGTCVYDNKFLCVSSIQSGSGKSRSTKLFIIIGVGAVGVILLICASFYLLRKMVASGRLTMPWNKTPADKKADEFLRYHRSLAPKRYRYSEIKKMTNSFKEILGQGGYGAVYKGKLPNDRCVAVKLLNVSKGNGDDFINEAASISRTSHVNIVTLLGFCLKDQKKALVYEFMPNGSLEKFILQGSKHLGWEKLYQITVGIARGLEYLHVGCNTKILHFDIKPHNILLDEDLCPKIADFGLSKLSSSKESKVSMQQARGTIGYIAPEIFNRNYGSVSHKSDVYSYGMMVIEMVGGRKNLDMEVTNKSEVYFPDWIYRRLELGTEFQGLQGVVASEENEIVKKMLLVGLWCIQTNPSDRPSITKVIEMLVGSLEALEIPPKPVLASPPRAAYKHRSSSESTTETECSSQTNTMSSNV